MMRGSILFGLLLVLVLTAPVLGTCDGSIEGIGEMHVSTCGDSGSHTTAVEVEESTVHVHSEVKAGVEYEESNNTTEESTANMLIHVRVVAHGLPVKAVGYVVNEEGIVVEIEEGAAFNIKERGTLVVAAVGYPERRVELSQVEGRVVVELSSEETHQGAGQARAEGSGEAEREKAEEGKGRGEAKVKPHPPISLDEIRERIRERMNARVEGIKVVVKNGQKVYVAVVRKPMSIGPITLPFEVTEEIEIPAGEVEGTAEVEVEGAS